VYARIQARSMNSMVMVRSARFHCLPVWSIHVACRVSPISRSIPSMEMTPIAHLSTHSHIDSMCYPHTCILTHPASEYVAASQAEYQRRRAHPAIVDDLITPTVHTRIILRSYHRSIFEYGDMELFRLAELSHYRLSWTHLITRHIHRLYIACGGRYERCQYAHH
jgi:hypothetical protein